VHTALALIAGRDPWAAEMPRPQRLSAELIAEGHTIPIARVRAMHEGKRRVQARCTGGTAPGAVSSGNR
jgi:bifunctional non-homologous end joining protein LigD